MILDNLGEEGYLKMSNETLLSMKDLDLLEQKVYGDELCHSKKTVSVMSCLCKTCHE